MADQRGPSIAMRIDQEGKFYAKLLSREMISLQDETSHRIGDSVPTGSVPFEWESKPGTPIPAAAAASAAAIITALPSLSPPPSYFYSPSSGKMFNKKTMVVVENGKKRWRLKSISAVLPRLRWSRRSKLQSSSSSSSWPSSPLTHYIRESSCCSQQGDGYRSSWAEDGGSRFLFCLRVRRNLNESSLS